jgi:hypothetical protein
MSGFFEPVETQDDLEPRAEGRGGKTVSSTHDLGFVIWPLCLAGYWLAQRGHVHAGSSPESHAVTKELNTLQ